MFYKNKIRVKFEQSWELCWIMDTITLIAGYRYPQSVSLEFTENLLDLDPGYPQFLSSLIG